MQNNHLSMNRSEPRGSENVCKPAVKYKFSKKLGVWCRTSFSLEKDDAGYYYRQNNAFSNDRNTLWDKWTKSPNPGR